MDVNLRNMLDRLDELKNIEASMANLYSVFIALSGDEYEPFWNKIKIEELDHVKYLQAMKEMVQEDFMSFKVNRMIEKEAILQMVAFIEDKTERAKKKEIDPGQFLFIARDIEKSYLENKFNLLLHSDNYSYGEIVYKITIDTKKHLKRIEDMIEKINNKT